MTRRALMGVAAAALVVCGSAAAAGAAGGGAGEGRDGHRRVQGEIVSIDEARGALRLKAGDVGYTLHLPPGAVKGFRRGDRLTLELTVRPAAAGDGAASGPARRPRVAPLKAD